MGVFTSKAAPESISFYKNYILGDQIGKGAYGAVYRCWKCDNPRRRFAVKILLSKSPLVKRKFKSEVELLTLCKSEHVIELVDSFQDTGFSYLVMEQCRNNVLEAVLQVNDVVEADLAQVFDGMAKAIAHCHNSKVVHRDIKPLNFLVPRNMRIDIEGCVVKLCDFGAATRMPEGKKLTDVCGGTPQFQAPEMLRKAGYDYKIDIWALGTTAYLMLFGSFPYNPPNNDAIQMVKWIREGRQPISYEANKFKFELSEGGVEFVKTLLDRDPQSRPSADQALNLPYLKAHRKGQCNAPEISQVRSRSKEKSSLHSTIREAADKTQFAKELWEPQKISPEAFAKFEQELEKLASNFGIRRCHSQRTMTLPAENSFEMLPGCESDTPTPLVDADPWTPLVESFTNLSRLTPLESISPSSANRRGSCGSSFGRKRSNSHSGTLSQSMSDTSISEIKFAKAFSDGRESNASDESIDCIEFTKTWSNVVACSPAGEFSNTYSDACKTSTGDTVSTQNTDRHDDCEEIR